MTQDNLFAQLKHPNPHLRDRAMFEIAETRDAETISKLMSALDDEDVVYRRAAVKALGMIGQDAVPSIVDGMLHSESITVKGSCVKALTQVALNYPELPFPAEGLQGLKKSMQDPNPVVYIAAITIMSRGEVNGGDRRSGLLALSLIVGLAIGLVGLALWLPGFELTWLAPFCLIWLGLVLPKFIQAIRTPDAAVIRIAVRTGVISLIALDSTLASASSGWIYGMAVLALLPLSRLLADRFAVT